MNIRFSVAYSAANDPRLQAGVDNNQMNDTECYALPRALTSYTQSDGYRHPSIIHIMEL